MKIKKWFAALLCAGLSVFWTLPAYAVPGSPYAQYVTASSGELWEQFYEAETQKKLIDLRMEPIREQIRLLEHSGIYLQTGAAPNYQMLMDLKNQEYALHTQKEQYEMIKKNAESQLTLLGEIKKPHEIQYELSSGLTALSGKSAQDLQMEKEALKLREDELELQKKTLDYTYKLGQISEGDFAAQYKQVFRAKEEVKRQRERVDAELSLMVGVNGPKGLGPKGKGPK